MTIVSSEILKKKVNAEISKGNDVFEFLYNYVNEKSYGSFRTFSKVLKEIVEELKENGLLKDKQYEAMKNLIKEKQTIREPELVFSIHSFFEEYIKTFKIRKDDEEDILNLLVLIMPFLLCKTFVNCLTVKFEDVEFIDLDTSLVLRIRDGKKVTNIKIENHHKEYEYLFNNNKRNSDSEFIFSKVSKYHTVFSIQLEKFLQKFVSKPITSNKYLTVIKNSLKYSKYHFVSEF